MEDLLNKLLDIEIDNRIVNWIESNEPFVEEKRSKKESFCIVIDLAELKITALTQFDYVEEVNKYELATIAYNKENVVHAE